MTIPVTVPAIGVVKNAPDSRLCYKCDWSTYVLVTLWNPPLFTTDVISRQNSRSYVIIPSHAARQSGALFINMVQLKSQYEILITYIIKCGLKLFIHFQTSAIAPFKFGIGLVISFHI